MNKSLRKFQAGGEIKTKPGDIGFQTGSISSYKHVKAVLYLLT
jgi:hypothetical protein